MRPRYRGYPTRKFGAVATAGEKDLTAMLRTLSAHLDANRYIFGKVSCQESSSAAALSALGGLGVAPICTFLEEEGLTVILKEEELVKLRALPNFDYIETPFSRLSLEVHSSLEAVGLTAAVSARLTGSGISANVVAAYCHDHFFVQSERAEEALEAIMGMADDACKSESR